MHTHTLAQAHTRALGAVVGAGGRHSSTMPVYLCLTRARARVRTRVHMCAGSLPTAHLPAPQQRRWPIKPCNALAAALPSHVAGFVWVGPQKEELIGANASRRGALVQELRDIAVGLLYFQQTDEDVPASDRAAARKYVSQRSLASLLPSLV